MAENYYKSQTRRCESCGGDYHPCHPRQRTCSKRCAGALRSAAKQSAAAEFVPLTIGGDAAVVHLTKGAHAIVDPADFAELAKHKWFLHSDGSAARGLKESGGRHRCVRMHQQLMPLPDGMEPDHRDLDRLNNRRSNLRPATSSEQKMNQRLKSNNTSGFKGVAWDERRQKWMAFITKGGRRTTIGRFDDKAAAVAARAAVAKYIFGEFARESA